MTSKEVVETLEAKGTSVRVVSTEHGDYLSLTDLARFKSDNPKMVIQNWMRNRNTIEFLGVWEELNNPEFKGIEFDAFRKEAGLNSFVLTPTQWVERTAAVGIQSRRGRYGGTFAHADIAFEFASWLSPEFKLYVIKDYQRLKADEASRLNEAWQERRLFSKMNYRVHTDAIKECLEPMTVGAARRYVYANEADVLNVALFGKTARQWREAHPDAGGNIRDHSTITELLVLANLESLNAEMIRAGIAREDRVVRLRESAATQMRSLAGNPTLVALEESGGTVGDLPSGTR
ncbi:KilA-N domain-containing protein [Atopobiaceae bacterium 24-176]